MVKKKCSYDENFSSDTISPIIFVLHITTAYWDQTSSSSIVLVVVDYQYDVYAKEMTDVGSYDSLEKADMDFLTFRLLSYALRTNTSSS